MKSTYHIHDRKLVECPEHRQPRPLNRAMKCGSEKHKSACNGTGLGLVCTNHARPLTPMEVEVLKLQLQRGTTEEAARAKTALKIGTVIDPKPMRFAAV